MTEEQMQAGKEYFEDWRKERKGLLGGMHIPLWVSLPDAVRCMWAEVARVSVQATVAVAAARTRWVDEAEVGEQLMCIEDVPHVLTKGMVYVISDRFFSKERQAASFALLGLSKSLYFGSQHFEFFLKPKVAAQDDAATVPTVVPDDVRWWKRKHVPTNSYRLKARPFGDPPVLQQRVSDMAGLRHHWITIPMVLNGTSDDEP